MIRMINRTTGGIMWVHETRIEEYLAAGHRMAPLPELPKKPARTKKTQPEKG